MLGFSLMLGSLVSSPPAQIPVLGAEFIAWQERFGKAGEYAALGAEERSARFGVWRDNGAFVDAHNAAAAAAGDSYELAMNQFGDRTRAEFRSLHRARSRAPSLRPAAAAWAPPPGAPAPPAKWDWRGRGAVSPVKNQFEPHSCGSCWAFSAIAGIESRYAMDGHKPAPSFSAQNLVDCTLGGADTCDEGGEMHDGVEQIAVQQKGAVSTEKDYPTTGLSKGVCHFDAATAVATNVSGYANVTVGDEDALMAAVAAGGVIPAGINSDAQAFMFYSSGILNISAQHCRSGPAALDHGVAIVGYGTSAAGVDYWSVKNSYGLYWGEKGYFRIVRGRNSCGIATDCIVVQGKGAD